MDFGSGQTVYLPLWHEDLHLLWCCCLVSSELVFHILVTQGSQVYGQEPVQDQNPLVQWEDSGDMSGSRHEVTLTLTASKLRTLLSSTQWQTWRCKTLIFPRIVTQLMSSCLPQEHIFFVFFFRSINLLVGELPPPTGAVRTRAQNRNTLEL